MPEGALREHNEDDSIEIDFSDVDPVHNVFATRLQEVGLAIDHLNDTVSGPDEARRALDAIVVEIDELADLAFATRTNPRGQRAFRDLGTLAVQIRSGRLARGVLRQVAQQLLLLRRLLDQQLSFVFVTAVLRRLVRVAAEPVGLSLQPDDTGPQPVEGLVRSLTTAPAAPPYLRSALT